MQQYDALWPMLSARQHLDFSFALFQPELGASARAAAIDAILERVGLTEQQHTRAGNQFIRGLSGGLKRRLSIAMALAKKPQVLLLDEPTTGVDSASASRMMTFLKQIAEQEKIVVVCTIHQPSASVFAGFDDTLILASGRVAYFGPAARMSAHFDGLGRSQPVAGNPAEFVLDLVNKDFTSAVGVNQILDAWEEAAPPPPQVAASALPGVLSRASFGGQVCTLLKRQAQLLVRDPLIYVARAVANSVLVLFFAIIYLEAQHRVQSQALQRMFYFVFCIAIPSQLSIGVVILSNMTLRSVRREVKDGMYHPLAWWLASSAIQAPMMWVLAAMALWPAYALVFARTGPETWASFPMVQTIMATELWCFEGVAEMFSLFANPINGMLYFLFFFIFAFLFCGMFIAFGDVIWALRWICYITPFGYTLRSSLYSVMLASPDYEGALYCTPGQIINPGMANQTQCPERGFYCPEDPMFVSCFGVSGLEILDSVGVNFPVVSGTDVSVAADVARIVAIGVVARLIFVVGLLRTCFSAAVVKPPADGRKAWSKADDSAHGANAVGAVAAALGTSASIVPATQGEVADADAAAAAAVKSPSQVSVPIAPPSAAAAGASKSEITFAAIGYEIAQKPNPADACKKAPKKSAAAAAEDGAAAGAAEGGGGGGKGPKVILRDVSARIPAGNVLAIIGPSGAGKTILLNTLTLGKGPGRERGTVAINGHKVTQSVYISQCCYVPREDTLWPTLTARQHLETSIALYQPKLAGTARAEAIDYLLAATGMVECQHTKAGDATRQGLSGGQRRRLSLALALTKEPRVIVLDEPTSGLDSAAAAAIMRLLKEIAISKGASIICTIHQPSAAVYAGFDQCLVLSEGRAAFCGDAADLPAHFGRIGLPLPPNANPAEFVLDVVSKDISSKEKVALVLDQWGAAAPRVDVPPKTALPPPIASAGFCTQVRVLFGRSVMLAVKDPVLYVSRMLLFFVMITAFGILYVETRDQVQEQVMPRLFYLNWVCCLPSILCLITVFALNGEYATARTEMQNGMYSPIAYTIATGCVQVPMMLVLSLCACVPGYVIGNLPWEGFWTMVLIYGCNLWCFENMAQLFSLGSNALFGMFNFIQIWSSSLLFTGVVFRGKDVTWILRWMYYGFPLKWFFNALVYTAINPAEYAGTANCTLDPAHPERYNLDPTRTLGCTRGFYCPDSADPLACFGPTGQDILETLNANYESATKEDERLLDVFVMLMLAGIFKAFYLVFVVVDVRTKVDIRQWLNVNSPGLVMLSAGIMCVVSLVVSGKSYCTGYATESFPDDCGAPMIA